MRKFLFYCISILLTSSCCSTKEIQVGALSFDEYIPLIEGKRVSILSNQTGMVSADTHLLDTLLTMGVNVVSIMSPEHGFRGTADAGEHVSSSIDEKTGIPIRSLYEKGIDRPSEESMNEFDVLLFDLQDIGARFYTYNATMARMMDACALFGKKMIILDRPNPIGYLVDGPILDMKYKSGVGWLPIPVAHGMTLGELALMINGEGWLKDGAECDLTVIKCRNYERNMTYDLPVRPSPNIPDMRSVYLYTSICYFEGTPVSLGRGTDKPFQMYGHPDMKGCEYSFTPRSVLGAKFPPQLDNLCYGVDLRTEPSVERIKRDGINLEYVVDAYNNLGIGEKFFRPFFELLIGRSYVREMIIEGKSADEIEAVWADDIVEFKEQRKPYLLYK